jgi:crotonobetainyl-CoA:carnitine CoA-transferase CaiB-like acyl-CoA transferase
MAGALDGLKVLDLSRFIAGPLCGMVLGDMGADVVKIERPGKGEDARAIAPQVGGESLYVMMYNRNKRGMSLDFRHPRAQALLRELAAQADVVIENFRPGTMERMGCGWDALSAANPRLVMVSISGFGPSGPYAERPCFDVIAQAMSGLMEITGEPGRMPLPSGAFIVDQVTGLYAALGAVTALQARERTGRGQLVDTSLMASAITLLLTAIPERALLGVESTRRGARDRYSAPANNFQASDGGWVHLSAGNDQLFPRFLAQAGLTHLASDQRFATHAARVANAAAIETIVAGWVAQHSAAEVVAKMAAAEVPCGKVATIGEMLDDPHVRQQNLVVELEHPSIGKLPMHGITLGLSDTPGAIRRPAPSVGQHTREVLRDWAGLDAAAIDELVAARVVGAA